jgi:hypothetical protein
LATLGNCVIENRQEELPCRRGVAAAAIAPPASAAAAPQHAAAERRGMVASE